jgi:anti-sigma B factor antagonist
MMTLATDRAQLQVLPRRGSVRVAPSGHAQTVVRLAGDHDLSTVPALTEAFGRAVSADRTDVLLDLSEVTFIDASTVNVLLSLRSSLAENSRTLTIHEPAACVSRLLAICGGPLDLTGSDRAG